MNAGQKKGRSLRLFTRRWTGETEKRKRECTESRATCAEKQGWKSSVGQSVPEGGKGRTREMVGNATNVTRSGAPAALQETCATTVNGNRKLHDDGNTSANKNGLELI